MERAFEHRGDVCTIEARLEAGVWHVEARRGIKLLCEAGQLRDAERFEAEACGLADPLRALLDAYENRIRTGDL